MRKTYRERAVSDRLCDVVVPIVSLPGEGDIDPPVPGPPRIVSHFGDDDVAIADEARR
jgi:hypothetical protein